MSAAAETYAEKVVQALSGQFPDLTKEITAQVVRKAVAAQHANPQAGFEVIIDSPFVANWRLKASMDNPRLVRVADYRMHPSDDREDRLNAALADLA